MSITIAQSEVNDLGAITDLLQQAFQVPAGAAILNPELLRWKYYDSHPEWNGPRSYVARDGGKIVAHAGVWPQHIRTAAAEIPALGFYDWVSHSEYPGAGLQIVKHLLAMNKPMLVIGGADITRKILPRFGFAQMGSVSIYARVLRAWKQFRTRPSGSGWREAGLLGRNFGWSLQRSSPHRNWRAEPVVNATEAQFVDLQRESTAAGTMQSASFLDYYRRCPTAPVKLFRLLHHSDCAGYFAFSDVNRQIRILDLRVVGSQEDWNAACSLIIQKAREERGAVELIGLAATPQLSAAFEANRFQRRDTRPLFLYDPSNVVTPYLPLHIGMLDDDSGFLPVPRDPYLT